MNEVEIFTHFQERCDNFANCLDPKFGPENNDPRVSDTIEYACSIYSFCPDPCCPIKHISNFTECWNNSLNPCFEQSNKKCSLKPSENINFRSLVLNEWNVTCQCELKGFRWNSKYRICVDINECTDLMNPCIHETETCVNLVGSYRCICAYGYEWNEINKQCTDSSMMELIHKHSNSVLNQGQKIRISAFRLILNYLRLGWSKINKIF